MGFLLADVVHSAGVQDRDGVKLVLARRWVVERTSASHACSASA